jgi:predicted transcriptional regulator
MTLQLQKRRRGRWETAYRILKRISDDGSALLTPLATSIGWPHSDLKPLLDGLVSKGLLETTTKDCYNYQPRLVYHVTSEGFRVLESLEYVRTKLD